MSYSRQNRLLEIFLFILFSGGVEPKQAHSGSSGGASHEPFGSTEFPTLRRKQDQKPNIGTKLDKSASVAQSSPYPPHFQPSEVTKYSKRGQGSNFELGHSREDLLVQGNLDQHRHYLQHHHPGDPHLHQVFNSQRLFSGKMTAEEVALVLEAAQAFVDPPEKFSSKVKSGQLNHSTPPISAAPVKHSFHPQNYFQQSSFDRQFF